MERPPPSEEGELPPPFGERHPRRSGRDGAPPATRVSIGEDDLGPNLGGQSPTHGAGGGMLVGPDHPVFDQPYEPPRNADHPPGILPRYDLIGGYEH